MVPYYRINNQCETQKTQTVPVSPLMQVCMKIVGQVCDQTCPDKKCLCTALRPTGNMCAVQEWFSQQSAGLPPSSVSHKCEQLVAGKAAVAMAPGTGGSLPRPEYCHLQDISGSISMFEGYVAALATCKSRRSRKAPILQSGCLHLPKYYLLRSKY